MTEYIVTLADNGYIVESDGGEFLDVYEGKSPSEEMCENLLAELLVSIEKGVSSRFKVEVKVTPIEGYKFSESMNEAAPRNTERDKT